MIMCTWKVRANFDILLKNYTLCTYYIVLPSISEISTSKQYILMEARLEALFKKPDDYKLISKFPGSTLKGEEYEPLFDYYIEVRRLYLQTCSYLAVVLIINIIFIIL